ncbi:HNH endonuclease signature motif containing protein [Catelliglobosispora koreensis]|uniref:HNH endonuclease signature motif containing protein n=1 Tax=Catelliglobosispora koreensis TaxID=129052 RepID=UPI0003777AF1
MAGQPLPQAFRDPRTPAQRRHDALLEVFGLAIATEELPANGGCKAQIVITAPYDVIAQKVHDATLDTGEQLSAAAVRRLACDAGIVPSILDTHSVPLDLGRERRLITGALRRALILRDKGCAFPGCERPPKWCHGHHKDHWIDGGETSLENSVLLCGFHHRLIHHDEWQIVFASDGHPEFIPPEWLDPSRTPQRNLYHLRT